MHQHLAELFRPFRGAAILVGQRFRLGIFHVEARTLLGGVHAGASQKALSAADRRRVGLFSRMYLDEWQDVRQGGMEGDRL